MIMLKDGLVISSQNELNYNKLEDTTKVHVQFRKATSPGTANVWRDGEKVVIFSDPNGTYVGCCLLPGNCFNCR